MVETRDKRRVLWCALISYKSAKKRLSGYASPMEAKEGALSVLRAHFDSDSVAADWNK